MNRPPPDVLAAFGVTASPVAAEHGMGRTWIAGDVVLKPVDHGGGHTWLCEVYDAWSCESIAVARPLRAEGEWSFRGWGAQSLLPGRTARAGDDPEWFRGVHAAFHEAVAGLGSDGYVTGSGRLLALIEARLP